jgi:type II secretory pathway pseudopilin PulG
MRPATPYGFSLVETIITFLLVILVLGVALQLLNEYSTAMNFASGKETTLGVAQVVLQQIVDEARESTVLESPGASASATDLRFRRVNPGGNWIPSPLPPAPPAVWEPYAAAQQLEVQYLLSAGGLTRNVSTPTAPAPATSTPSSSAYLATTIAGFQTQTLATGELQIQISVQESAQIMVLTTRLLRTCP